MGDDKGLAAAECLRGVTTVPGQHVLPWTSWEEAVPQWTEGSSQIAAGSHCVFRIPLGFVYVYVF